MPRTARLTNPSTATIYHLMSRTALDGFPLGDVEKEQLVSLMWSLSKLYFVDILGYCVMGNHVHIVARMHTADHYSDADIKKRYADFYGEDKDLCDSQLPLLRRKLSDISVFMQELKQRFTRFYNKSHNRRGFFWGGRFKSVIVEEGETLINLLGYVDLNPVRAGIVEKPETYRWSSLGYHSQTGNKHKRLAVDFGIPGWEKLGYDDCMRLYRQFVYEVGALGKGGTISQEVLQKKRDKNHQFSRVERFRLRIRWFTDSGVIGTKTFVAEYARQFQDHFQSRHTKTPRPISGMNDIFSLKRLTEQ